MESVLEIVYVSLMNMLYSNLCMSIALKWLVRSIRDIITIKASKSWRLKLTRILIIMRFEGVIRNVVIGRPIVHQLKCLECFFSEKLSFIHIIIRSHNQETKFSINYLYFSRQNTAKIYLKTDIHHIIRQFLISLILGFLRLSDDLCGQPNSSRYLTEMISVAILRLNTIFIRLSTYWTWRETNLVSKWA